MSAARPLVGVTCASLGSGSTPRYGLNQKYVAALQEAGADSVLLPPGTSSQVLERLDGLLLPGGADIDPARYGEAVNGSDTPDPARDELELRLFEAAQDRLPVLAICRGLQLVNVALGGSLVQHLDGHRQAGDRGDLSHRIVVEAGSRLAQITGTEAVAVNSLHHQAVGRVANGLRVSARAEDGTVEGLETADGMVFAIQCHPEELTRLDWARRLFADFVAQAAQARTNASLSSR